GLAETEKRISQEQMNAESALSEVVRRFEDMMESLEDEYLHDRGADIRDVGQRILAKLLFVDGELVSELDEPSVVVSTHLVPSLTVHMDREKILAFATEKGGYTSHAAILARSLGIPAVTGLLNITDELVNGMPVVVDGMEGLVIAKPDPEVKKRFESRARQFQSTRREIIEETEAEPFTKDGVRIQVRGNVGRPGDIENAVKYNLEGIGLYRTEFQYLSRSNLPDEDELARGYSRAAEAFADEGVILRVLDIGGDKFPPSIPLAHEENPFMGLRGLRLILERKQELLLPQLRAMIRASANGLVKVLYPMVASVEDLQEAREAFEEAWSDVREAGYETAEEIPQGIMIEVPSCVHVLPEMLELSDFATVGTNDLVQYVLAADRNSERMVDAYDPCHPAVVRLLDQISRTGQEFGMQISVCGVTASDLSYIPLLIGLGYRKLSVNIQTAPHVRYTIGQLDTGECERMASESCDASETGQVHELIEQFIEDLNLGEHT
ncbi:MAG: phosphoenolpyruvate--protein phosphotransferase, partial [Planctomycetes bacterium]|nr:phosphoenolpyruvate--protein phosphotransferase [Planctomycetota bacterium]